MADTTTDIRTVRNREASDNQTSKNIFASNELDENSVCSILELTAADGKNYKTKVYNLDAILSVGYRVNSKNATLFRRWANSVLKDYMLKGYSLNHRFERLEDKIDTRFQRYDSEIQRLSNQVDFSSAIPYRR